MGGDGGKAEEALGRRERSHLFYTYIDLCFIQTSH